jgi:ATP synthase protein I
LLADDGFTQGVDAALVMAVFVGAGYGLDRWLGTAPWFIVGLSMLGAVGLFMTWKARYSARMDELQEQRERDATRHRRDAAAGSTIEP